MKVEFPTKKKNSSVDASYLSMLIGGISNKTDPLRRRCFGTFLDELKADANQETLLKKHFEAMLLTMLHGWANKKEAEIRTQILRLQNILLGYANEETIGKHSKSVFLRCFLNDSSFAPTSNICLKHNICVLKAENAFEIFQKHFLHPGRNFASGTMFPRLRRP